jgi:hypothetical protein
MAGGAVSVKKELSQKRVALLYRLLRISRVISITLALFFNTIIQGETMQSNFPKQPYFTIHFNTSGCYYEFRVNDVPVTDNYHGGPLNAAYPISDLLQSGENY